MGESPFREYPARSVVKAVSYRVVILVADFVARRGISIPRGIRKDVSCAVFFFTGRVEIAPGLVVVSNLYTTVLYLLHERFRDGIPRGRAAG